MIVREIVERPMGTSSPPVPPQPPKPSGSRKYGFPLAKRRPMSASDKSSNVSIVNQDSQPESGPSQPGPSTSRNEANKVRAEMDRENTRRIEAMGEQERQDEVQELEGRFGASTLAAFRRRAKKRIQSNQAVSSIPGPSRSSSAAPKAEADKLRTEVEMENIRRVEAMDDLEREEEIRELEERFGQETLIALRRRAERRKRDPSEHGPNLAESSATAASLLHPNIEADRKYAPRVRDDTTPAALKERYFPNHPVDAEKMAWLQPATPSNDTSIRFDLSGRVLSTSQTESIPTSMGLHHHGTSPDLAGYTLEDVLWLCRSTVPSQRITMMGVLARIIGDLLDESMGTMAVVRACSEAEIQKKGVQLGVEVLLGFTKSLGVLRAAIDLLFEALGGRKWVWLDVSGTSSNTRPDDQFEEIPFLDLVPRLQEVLAKDSGLPPSSHAQLIRILRRASWHSQELAEVIVSIVPLVVQQHSLQSPWPLENQDIPSIDALRLLQDSVSASRECANRVLDSRVADQLLKFLVVQTWLDDTSDTSATVYDIAAEVLRVHTALGRYGMAASLVGIGTEVIRSLGTWIQRRCTTDDAHTTAAGVIIAYYESLAVWTVCAIDPHKTTPEHDITWAQVSAMGWVDEALGIVSTLINRMMRPDSSSFGGWNAISSVLGFLVVWAEGAIINEADAGKLTKGEVIERLDSARMSDLVPLIRRHADMFDKTVYVAILQLLRLELLVDRQQEQSVLSAETRRWLVTTLLLDTEPEHATDTSPTIRALRYTILKLARRDHLVDPSTWAKTAFQLMPLFEPGEEPLALEWVDEFLKEDLSLLIPDLIKKMEVSEDRFIRTLPMMDNPDGLQILRPFLQYSILPSATQVTGPRFPTRLYLEAATSLRWSATTSHLDSVKREPGLPLPEDWLYTPLNELLQSSTSTALAQIPPDWNASELDVVRTTLSLTYIQCLVDPGALSRSRTILNLMKVFMLENEQQSASSESEIFRESSVASLITQLTDARLSRPSVSPTSLESVAMPFLGPEMPFYQFYTDFVTLYEAISFSDVIFSQFVLPPLAMNYPVDYRKLIWVEHPTVLCSIPLRSTDEILCEYGNRTPYYSPRETDPDVLAGYTRALIRGWVGKNRSEFLWSVATFHLATLFWTTDVDNKNVVRVNLMKAIITSAPDEAISRVLAVDITKSVPLKSIEEDEYRSRLHLVAEIAGNAAGDKVRGLSRLDI